MIVFVRMLKFTLWLVLLSTLIVVMKFTALLHGTQGRWFRLPHRLQAQESEKNTERTASHAPEQVRPSSTLMQAAVEPRIDDQEVEQEAGRCSESSSSDSPL